MFKECLLIFLERASRIWSLFFSLSNIKVFSIKIFLYLEEGLKLKLARVLGRNYLGKIRRPPKFMPARNQMTHPENWTEQSQNSQKRCICLISRCLKKKMAVIQSFSNVLSTLASDSWNNKQTKCEAHLLILDLTLNHRIMPRGSSSASRKFKRILIQVWNVSPV